jgi:AcrR family transcriptional regulator
MPVATHPSRSASPVERRHPAAGRAGRQRTSRPPETAGTRARLVTAAAAEFAAHGFAGGNVDRIARAARVNKAMIYYHFHSKAALYREILGDMFRAVCARVRVVADSAVTPDEKIRGFIDAIAAEAQARPHFPPTWFREIAEGGRHLDDATLADIAAIVGMLTEIIREGVAARRFRPVNPLLVHGGIVGPVLLFFASDRLRQRLGKAGAANAARITHGEVVAHVHAVTLGVLRGKLS